MPATDTILATEQQLWTLLLASSGFTGGVRVGNQIRLDNLRDFAADIRRANVKNPADGPLLIITPTDFRLDPRAPRTLCRQSLIRVVTFEHKITGTDRTINAIGQVRAEIEAAYLASGPQLGIPAIVAKYEMSGRYQTQSPQAGGIAARQIILNVAVTIKG